MDLRRLTQDYRLSQKELAELFGCNPSNVSNIVAGKRNLTGLQVRLLIDKFGRDVIAKYADPSELPPVSSVAIGSHHGSVDAVNSNVQNGDGNSITADAALVQVVKQQSDQISRLLDQQDRLISLLEKNSINTNNN